MDRHQDYGTMPGRTGGESRWREDGPGAFQIAEAQARYEALLARAERRRWAKAGSETPQANQAALLLFPLRFRWRPSGQPGPRPQTCQWLYGDGPFTDADKCGGPTARGQSYCRAHLARMVLQPEAAEQPRPPGP